MNNYKFLSLTAMKRKAFLFVILMMATVTAKPYIVEFAADDGFYSSIGANPSYHETVSISSAELITSLQTFSITLQDIEYLQYEYVNTPTCVIEEIIQELLNTMQQTLSLLENVMKSLKESLDSIVRRLS